MRLPARRFARPSKVMLKDVVETENSSPWLQRTPRAAEPLNRDSSMREKPGMRGIREATVSGICLWHAGRGGHFPS